MKIHSGDSVDLEVSLGFGVKLTLFFRLQGVTVPAPGAEGGTASRAALAGMLNRGQGRVVAESGANTGEWLCDIYVQQPEGGEVCVNEAMVKSGFAKAVEAATP